ncbi:NAD(P)-binding protein [Aaosphaeria arxii CBS 175.79]|uniref:NAD(P)-binding protein n=1 Tax=Aaosphaeria arxii CBS 175.79 TaxID=1450172 RepID=A0A6A5XF81_9PLEO|nr:NAD(P)-binding protein [Aaosphaeria arxii CBS 175.79]KAF2011506.1 NAD(P)-binding protein [Aaosphaeria arxii CBS 175.79]
MSTGVALIGSGIFAKEEHLPAIRSTPLLTLKAVYSRSLASAKGLSEGLSDVELYSEDQEGRTFDKLLERTDIAAVVIALPILVQPEFIKKALSAGKHVLAEKPIAKDVATAVELVNWYNSNIKKTGGPTFSIAENFRYIDSYVYGASQVAQLGRVLGFRTRVSAFVKAGTKYFETAWRKKPEYQGGFLLDGGVHFIAATRLLLGDAAKPVKIAAFSTQLQEHLPPVDTLQATILLKNGSSGTFDVSFGTTFTGSEYAVAAEKGTVTVTRGKVVVKKDGQEEVQEFPDEGNGVKQEVKAWAEGLVKGEANSEQSPEEALKDLELLEAGLRSGENKGAAVELKF